MKNTISRESGMTLIAMVTALVIVSVLTMIASATYFGQQQRARRLDAKAALEQIAAHQERYYVTNFTYTANLALLGFSGNESESGYYVVSVPTADTDGFQAVAVPAPGSLQLDDTECQQFTIDNQSARGAAPDPDGECW